MGMAILRDQPQVGRPARDMDPGFRESLIPCGDSGDDALYHLDSERAVIRAIREQRQARP